MSLQALPLLQRLCRFGAPADPGKRLRGHEPKLRRASRTTRHLGAGAGGIDLCNDLLRKLRPADKRQPQRRKLMELDPSVLARPASVREQALNAGAPVAAVKVDLALNALDQVPPARLVAHPRGKIDRFDDYLLRFG